MTASIPNTRRRGGLCPPSLHLPLLALFTLFPLFSPSLSSALRSPSLSNALHSPKAQRKLLGRRGVAESRGGGGKSNEEWGRRRVQEASTADPCADMKAVLATDGLSYFVAPSSLRKCLDALPLEEDKVQQDINSVKLYFKNFYGSLRVGESSPNFQVPSFYNVMEELDKFLANFTSEKSSPRAYETLSRIISKLNDGHTFLIYGWQIQHLFPYNLVGVVEGDSTVVRVAPLTMHSVDQVSSVFKPNLEYYGAKVLTINGKDAWDFVLEWSFKLSGSYLNTGQRLNSAFGARTWGRDETGAPFWGSRVGDFSSRELPRWPGLKSDVQTQEPVDAFTLTLELETSKELVNASVPWLSQIPADTFSKSFTSAAALSKLFWKPLASSGGELRSQEMRAKFPSLEYNQRHPFVKNMKQRPRAFFKAPVAKSPFSRARQISSPKDFWPVFKLDDSKTAVVVISTFDTTSIPVPPTLPNEYVADYQSMVFLNESIKAFNTATSAGASQVIIDLRSNGGGTVSMGNFFVEMLMGTKALGGQTQLLVGNLRAETDFVKLLVEKKLGWYDGSGYLNLAEKNFTGKEGDTFFFPLQNQTYGQNGVEGVYGGYFKDGEYARDRYNALNLLYGMGVTEIPPILGGKPFILLSDGLCFSTCNNFAYMMRKTFGTYMVLVGGIPGSPFQPAGGGVAFISPSVTAAFYKTWESNEELAANPEAPKAFVGPIDVSMQTANGFVPVNASAPIEFNFLRADGWIMYNMTRLEDDSVIWAQAAGSFQKVDR